VIAGGAPAPLLDPVLAVSASPPRERAPRLSPPIVWETSEPAARERAQRAGMPMIVWARAEWAAAALEMERTAWAAPAVIEAARPFVALRLDLSAAEGDAERYAERYQIAAMPTTVLFDGRGRRVAVLAGYQDPSTLAAALRSASE
jgi:thiol:disulfide interchange protein